jgi:CRISPR-associated protein Csx17
MPELVLYGCTPEPLISYLKALGVLRLIAEQADPEARAAWRAGIFVLSSKFDADTLIQFFLEEYMPTPIAVPWSGNDFFGVNADGDGGPFAKTPTGSKVIEAFLASQSERLELYRHTIRVILRVMREMGINQKADIEGAKGKKNKLRFLAGVRARLSDAMVPWIDAAAIIEADSLVFNPLLGSGGGSDGNTHFSDNFMQNLWDCLPDFDAQRRQKATSSCKKERSPQTLLQRDVGSLRNALLRYSVPALKPGRTASLFDSGAVGGPNAGQGMERDALLNPWNFILALEGALCLAGAVVRRHGTNLGDLPAFSFSVRMVSAGYGTSVAKESGQHEVWLPLWERPVGLPELALLFSEGRAEVGRRTARNGTDFARAVAGLGVDVGIDAFARYGIVKGRVGGDNYNTAVSLGRFKVVSQPQVDLLQEADAWLERFRYACRGEITPPRFSTTLRRIDTAIFDFCRYGGKRRMAEILCALGTAERELGGGERFREERHVSPVPPLSIGWISACDDGTPEYRLALALASIRGDREGNVCDIRANFEPVEVRGSRWIWAQKTRAVVWSSADLCRNLTAILMRRIMDAAREGLENLPLGSRFAVSLDDVLIFLSGETDDHRIEQLLWGLILIDCDEGWGAPIGQTATPPRSPLPLPHLYAMLKLLFLPHKLSWPAGAEAITIKPDPEILGRLRSGDVQGACEIAARRLRASGVVPMPGPTPRGTWRRIKPGSHLDPMRLAAALLFPVRGTMRLARLTLRPPAEEVVLHDTDG